MQPLIDAWVYVVDDDAGVRDALAWLLRSRRVPCEVFDSAEAFQRRLQGTAPDTQPSCLLLDVRMPKMTGVELQSHLVKTGDDIPVIFMSGESLPHETLAAQQSNAITFLWKPFRTSELLDAINTVMSGKQYISKQVVKGLDSSANNVANLPTQGRNPFQIAWAAPGVAVPEATAPLPPPVPPSPPPALLTNISIVPKVEMACSTK